MAIDTAVITYIHLLETFPLPPERIEVIEALRSFRERYHAHLHREQKRQGKSEPGTLIPIVATGCELQAFASAVIAYIAYLRAASATHVVRPDVVTHLIRFQKRFLDSPQQVPVRD
jgi:hypothetical protein